MDFKLVCSYTSEETYFNMIIPFEPDIFFHNFEQK